MTLISKSMTPDKRFFFKHVSGDCLAGIGIMKHMRGIATIDRDAEIRVGDIVLCTKSLGAINTYIKQVKQIRDDSVIVSTAYANGRPDIEFEAADIYGVVREIYDEWTGMRDYARQEK